MWYRDYVIVVSPQLDVQEIYQSLEESPANIKQVAEQLKFTVRGLLPKVEPAGFDILIASGTDLDAVKQSLPELRNWDDARMLDMPMPARAVSPFLR